MVAALDHPSIIPIYDAGEVDGIVYIAMRYVSGGDLHQLLDAGPLAPDRAVAILEQVAGALDAAHAHDLVHRDVKPANVLIEAGGRVYLTDFGIAKRARTPGHDARRASSSARSTTRRPSRSAASPSGRPPTSTPSAASSSSA